MSKITIGDRTIGSGCRPFIIAEIGTNYRDDLDLASAMINSAADSNADAAKFQTHIAKSEMEKSAMDELGMSDLYDRISSYEMTVDEHKQLKKQCDDRGIEFISTPFSVEAVDILEEVGVQVYKIGSGELTNYELLKKVAETEKPVLISTGMAKWDTIKDAVSFVQEYTDEFALLYCVSEYPIEAEDFNLGVINRMKEEFEVPVGFSDHSQGIEAAVIAMANGADFVEKHFTIDRRLPGGDQEVSITPNELSELTEFAELIHQTRGTTRKLRKDEESISEWAHHSIVTTRKVESGEEFTQENLTTKRPGTGISASEYFEVIGQNASKDLSEGTLITTSDISYQE